MSYSPLNRAQLAEVFGNHETLKAFEKVFNDTTFTFPATIEEANALASDALAKSLQAFGVLANIADELDKAPRAQLGTISSQNNDSVDITGGRIGLDSGSVSVPSYYLGGDITTGLYRSAADAIAIAIIGTKLIEFAANLVAIAGKLSVTDQIISTVASGTPPFVVSSTTQVGNLYVDRAAFADVAEGLASPSSYPADATDLPTVIALANALKAAAISKGL